MNVPMRKGGKNLLVRSLLDATTTGISKRELGFILRNHMLAPEIEEHLERWRTKGAVQKFIVESKSRGRPMTMYRALEPLIEEEDA